MEARLLASGLGRPGGLTLLPDGRLAFCDGDRGELSVWTEEAVTSFAVTGGSPQGSVLASDGSVYVAQIGPPAAVQRVSADGTVDVFRTEIGRQALLAPRDLAFGPDRRLWLVDGGSEAAPGRMFAIDRTGGEMVLELPGAQPAGIAFDARRRLYWTEAASHRICRWEAGGTAVFCQLSDEYVPAGIAFAADGRAFVCTTVSGGVTVLTPDGILFEHLDLDAPATSCCFGGSTLYVAATEPRAYTGTFWAVDSDVSGLPLIPGAL